MNNQAMPHLWAGRVLQARQPQEHQVALQRLVLAGVSQAGVACGWEQA